MRYVHVNEYFRRANGAVQRVREHYRAWPRLHTQRRHGLTLNRHRH